MVIKLLSQKYTLEYCDPGSWADGAMGRTSEKKGEILISSQMPQTISDATLVHEVVHAIADMSGLRDISSNESIVSAIANGVYSFIVDNPVCVKLMIDNNSGQSDKNLVNKVTEMLDETDNLLH